MKTLSDYHQRPPLRWNHLVGLLLFLILGCMLFYASWDRFGRWSDQTKMTTSGKTAEATITTKYYREHLKRGGSIELYYVFAAEGRAHRGLVRVARSEWNKVSVGDKLEIRYLKDNPSVNEALTARKITPGEIAALGVFGAILWALGVWGFIARRPMRP